MVPVFFDKERRSLYINNNTFEWIRIHPDQFRQTIYNEADMIIDPVTHKVVGTIVIDRASYTITELNINPEYENILEELLREILDRAIHAYNAMSIKVRSLDERTKKFLIDYGFELHEEYTVHEFSRKPTTSYDDDED